MKAKDGDYVELTHMKGFNMRRPLWARIVQHGHDGRNEKLKILCGSYGSGTRHNMRAGKTFYMRVNNPSGNFDFRVFTEAEVPDEMWAAIAAEALTDERKD